MAIPKYAVVGGKPWVRWVFEKNLRHLSGRWHLLTEPAELTLDRLVSLSPRYVFFLHWSSMVPQNIVERFECVCFHMTDLPFGRGGSPLQNLVALGHRSTKLTAFRMTCELDGGPVYMKTDLSLEGGAEEIYLRAMKLAAAMIAELIRNAPRPIEQVGEVVRFRRRTPRESEIPNTLTDLQTLFDLVRMLDAADYPRAFARIGGFRFEFSRATLRTDRIEANVVITREAKEAK